jgi:hypothetical protein
MNAALYSGRVHTAVVEASQGPQIRRTPPQDPNGGGGGPDQTEKDAQEGRLARFIRPGEPVHLPLADAEIDAVQGHDVAAELLGNAGDLDDRNAFDTILPQAAIPRVRWLISLALKPPSFYMRNRTRVAEFVVDVKKSYVVHGGWCAWDCERDCHVVTVVGNDGGTRRHVPLRSTLSKGGGNRGRLLD